VIKVKNSGGSWAALGGGASFSGLTAATGANTINNAGHVQTWDWNSLTTGVGLNLRSSSITSGAILHVQGTNASMSPGGYGILSEVINGFAITGSSGPGTGVRGISTTGTGVFGSTGSVSSQAGVRGNSTNGSSYGGYFTNSGTTGPGVAVFGDASISHLTGIGVYGSGGTASGGYGVYCWSGNTNGCGGNRAWYNSSDMRLKKDIADLDPSMGLETIMRLRPVTYHWRTGDTTKTELGFIAQDVEKVLPELVGKGLDVETVRDDGTKEKITDVRTLSYANFVVPLIKAVQQQQGQIEELKAANDNLKAANDDLKDANADLGARLDALEARR